MWLEKEREALVQYGHKMVDAGLTTGAGGNLSIACRQRGWVAITPSGVAYDQLTAADIIVIDFQGQVVEGRGRPSSETGFHLALYAQRQDIQAVVHTHSVYATTLACLGWELPAVHYLVGFCGNKVPLAPYATYGSTQLADNICKAIGSYQAVLLANHGLVAVGPGLLKAFEVAAEIEFVARIYYQARSVGRPVILPDAEMARVIAKFKSYGQSNT